MTHFVNAGEAGAEIVPHIVNMTKRGADQIGGADYTLRLHRQREGDALGARVRASRLGRVGHHRRRARRGRRSRPGRSSS